MRTNVRILRGRFLALVAFVTGGSLVTKAEAETVCEATRRACGAVRTEHRNWKGVSASTTTICAEPRDLDLQSQCAGVDAAVDQLQLDGKKLKEAKAKLDQRRAKLRSLESTYGDWGAAISLLKDISDLDAQARQVLGVPVGVDTQAWADYKAKRYDFDAKILGGNVATCQKVQTLRPVCALDGDSDSAQDICRRDHPLRSSCAGVKSDVCDAVQARSAWCDAVALDLAHRDVLGASNVCAEAERVCKDPVPDVGPRPDDWLLGIQPSVAAQLRIPQLSGLPSVFFTNLWGLGFSFLTRHLEIMPVVRAAFSHTDLQAPGGQAQSANGWGVDGGARISVGWFDARTGGLYFSAYQGFSYLKLDASFGNPPYGVAMTEVFTEVGLGYKVPIGHHLRLDIFASALHIGVRPGADNFVDVTSYPTLGLGVDWLFIKIPAYK